MIHMNHIIWLGQGRPKKIILKKGDYDATEYKSNCPNGFGSDAGDEDCLFLNILVPDTLHVENDNKRPVMIWLHGGGFMFGSGPGNEVPEHQVILSLQCKSDSYWIFSGT